MNIEQALNFGKQELNKNEIEDSLLTDILKQSKEYLVINNTKELSSQEEKEFKEKVRKEIEILTTMNVVDITIVAKGIYMPEEKKKED